MLKRLFALTAAALLTAAMLTGQAPLDHLTFRGVPPATPPGSVSLRVFGALGTATCTYYVSAIFASGETAPTGPTATAQCPNALSGTDFVRVSWGAVPGAMRYHVFKTATAPATGSILLATTSSNFVDDVGQALSSWTKPSGYAPAFVQIIPVGGGLGFPAVDRGGQVYNVKAFGAVGDDVHDDAPAFAAAIAAMPSCSVGAGVWPHCGTVYAPPGVYLLNETISMDAGQRLTGAGPLATLLDYRGGSGAIEYHASTFNTGPGAQLAGGVSGLSINVGNASTTTPYGIHALNTIGFQGRDLAIYDSAPKAGSSCFWIDATGGDFDERFNLQGQFSNCQYDLYITNNNTAAGMTAGYGTLNLNLQTGAGQFAIYTQGNGASSPVEINQQTWNITVNIADSGACGWFTNYSLIGVKGLLECEQTSGTGGHGVFSDANSSFRIDTLNLAALTTPVQGGTVSSRDGYPVTFANLPAASSGNHGWVANITDSTTQTWGATAAGGGSLPAQVYSDGAAWTVSAK